jgi:SAM-dependent methyltransferase
MASGTSATINGNSRSCESPRDVMQRPPRLMAVLKMIPGLRESSYVLRAAGTAAANALHRSITGRTYAAARLEELFNEKPDPWNFEGSAEERARFQKTWELMPSATYRRILEIGCAEGHFTEQIAGRFPDADVLAVDLVSLAVDRAKARCVSRPNVRFQCLDVGREPIGGPYDLIFCMGVLEYGPAFGELDAIRRSIVGALAPGGYLVLETHAAPPDLQDRWWARRLLWGARAQHDCFRIDDLVPVAEGFVCGEARATTVFRNTTRC